jgi:hypothetical protein
VSARTHVHVREDAGKRSPRSPCPPSNGNHCDFTGERGGERGIDVPPAPDSWWEEVI